MERKQRFTSKPEYLPYQLSNNNKAHEIKPPLMNQKLSKSQSIKNEIVMIDKLNQQLLSIADTIKRTKALNTQYQKMPQFPNINALQDDIRFKLSQLIENIKQFYIEIDSKLQLLGPNIYDTPRNRIISGNDDLNRTMIQNVNNDMLMEKIQTLETSLKQTKSKENKLLEILQNMLDKYNITEQPTILKEELKREKTVVHFQAKVNPPMILNKDSTNKNIILQQNNNNTKPAKPNPSLLHPPPSREIPMARNYSPIPHQFPNPTTNQPYKVQQSVVSRDINKFKLRQRQQDPSEKVYMKTMCAKNNEYSSTTNSGTNQQSKKLGMKMNQLGQMRQDKQHRMNFMMEKLKF